MIIQKKYYILALLMSGAFSCVVSMDKEQANTQTLFECLRDKIDEDLGVKNSWVRSLAGAYASRSKASQLDMQGATYELDKIESYVPATYSKSSIYEHLWNKHVYFYALINKLAEHESAQFQNVTGSTIDQLIDPQRKITGLSEVMNSFVQQKVRPFVFDRLNCRLADQHIFFDGLDIHLKPLFAEKYVNVARGNLLTSTDGKYAKSTDDASNSIIWNLESGCHENIDDRDIIWERLSNRRESYDNDAVIDRVDRHAIFTNARYHTLLASYPRDITFAKESDNGGYLMVLFKKPTKESRLCNAAFKNSRGNREELLHLLNSETLKKVEGFPAENLKLLINKELSGMQQAKL